MGASYSISTKFTAIDRFSSSVDKMSRSTQMFATKASMAFTKVKSSLLQLQTFTSSVTSKIFNLRNAVALLFAGMVVKKIFDATVEVAKLGDEAAKTGRMLGVTAEYLQELRFAASRQGVESETLTKALGFLNKNVGMLQIGQGSLYTVLKQTDPALLRQLKNVKNNEEAFNLLVESISKMPNQQRKSIMATSAFGKSGLSLLKIIEAGTAGITQLREEARRFGGVMSNEAAAASEVFIDRQTDMLYAIEGLKIQIAVGLMPTIQKVMARISEWTAANKEAIKPKIKAFVMGISNAIKFLSDNYNTIVAGVKIFTAILLVNIAVTNLAKIALLATTAAQFGYNVVLGISAALSGASAFAVHGNAVAYGAFRTAVLLGTAAQWLFNAAMTANPIGLIIMGIAALIALVVVMIKKWDDWGAALVFVTGPIGLIITLIMELRDRWDNVTQAFQQGGILKGLKEIGKVLLSALILPFEAFLRLLAKIPFLADKLQPAIDSMNKFREGMFTEPNKPILVNPDAANTEAQTRVMTEWKGKLNVGVTAESGTTATVKQASGVTPSVSNTSTFKRN